MSIDPNNFAPQGKPTREQVRAVWDAHPKPSARKVANLMVDRGFDVSWRTIARWKKNDWREDAVNSVPLAEKGEVRGVKKALKAELAKIPPAVVKEADKIAEAGGLEDAVTGGALKDEDYARIEKMIADLDKHSEIVLDAIEAKERKIMNIVMMREATRRAHIMVLIPKDTSALVGSMTDAAKVTPTGKETPADRNGDDARLIEAKVNEPSPFALKLKQIREGAAA